MIPPQDPGFAVSAGQSDSDKDSAVRRVQSAIDALSEETSLSEESARDMAACLMLLARTSAPLRNADGGGGDEPSPSHESEPTSTMLGQFQVREMLGRGGFGVVFRANDTLLEREVALKLPRPESLISPDTKRRFLREAQAAAVLDHPGIVPVYETGEIGSLWYIASAYVAGPTLAQWLRECKELPSASIAAQIVTALAEATAHAHERGVLHLDLKPSNVLLERRQSGTCDSFPLSPRLGDFGLAGRTGIDSPHSCSFSIAGTLRYMAPEQLRGALAQIGVTSDVYGLGVILYELLTRHTPFEADTDFTLVRKIEEAEPVPVRSLRPEIPRDLEAICHKCLEKEPESRYHSARELADDLQRFLAGLPVKARPIGVAQRVARAARRRPAIAILTVALVASAVLGLAGIGYQWRQAQLHAAQSQHHALVAEDEKQLADKHLAEAQESLLSMSWAFQEALPFIANEDFIINEMGHRLHLMAQNATPEMQLPIAAARSSCNAWKRIGVVPAIAEDDRAALEKAAADWQAVVNRWPARGEYRRALALQLLFNADAHRRGGNLDDAQKYRRRAKDALSVPWPHGLEACREMNSTAVRLNQLADSLRRVHRDEDARCLNEAVVDLWRAIRDELPNDTDAVVQWAWANCRLVTNLGRDWQGPKADELLRAVENDVLGLPSSLATNAHVRVALAEVLRHRAELARHRKDNDAVIAFLTQAESQLLEAQKEQSRGADLRRAEVGIYRLFAGTYLAAGDKRSALRTFDCCRASYRDMRANEGLNASAQVLFARTCAQAGTLNVELGSSDDARKAFAEAITNYSPLDGKLRFVLTDLRAYAESATMLARMEEAAGEAAASRTHYEKAIVLWRRLQVRGPRQVGVKERLALVQSKLGELASTISAVPEPVATTGEEFSQEPSSIE